MDLNVSWNTTSKHTSYSSVRFSFALIFIVASLLGNALVIYAIYRFHRLRSPSNLIILNLSVADVLFTLISTPIDAWSQNKESVDVVACFITGVPSYLFCLVSIYTLVFVSIERFMATNLPVRHRLVFSTKLIQIGVSIIWILSGFLCGLPFSISRYVYVKEYFHCMVDWSANLACTIIFFILVYCFPVLTLTFCNAFVLRAARIGQRSRATASLSNSGNSQSSVPKLRFTRERRASFCIIVIVATFVICWTPYAIGALLVSLGNSNLPKKFMSAAVLLTIGNASLNPVIYGVMNRNYREAFRNILCPRKSHVRPF